MYFSIFSSTNCPPCSEEISKFRLEAASRAEPGVAAMLALAQAAQDRSLAAYKAAVDRYKAHLTNDPVISDHLKELQEDMLEKNLLRYSLVGCLSNF